MRALWECDAICRTRGSTGLQPNWPTSLVVVNDCYETQAAAVEGIRVGASKVIATNGTW